MSKNLKNLKAVRKRTTGKTVQADGWVNVLSGLGTPSRDKNTAAEVTWNRVTRSDADNMFSGDDLAGSIAKTIPFDGTRAGITWKVPDADNVDEFADTATFLDMEFERLQVWEKINWAWTMARVHGGAVLFVSVDDGKNLDEPLVPNQVRKVNALHVIDRWQLTITSADLFADLSDPLFGTPEFYRFSNDTGIVIENEELLIHHSRLIRFDGEKLPSRLFTRNNYWHSSIYSRLHNPIRNYSTAHDTIATIVQEVNQPVYKIMGLSEAVSQDEDELVVKRLQIINMLRSSLRAVVLDAEDEFQFMQTAVQGVPELVQLTKDRLVAATDIPHTRLLGESPNGGGIGETGKSELTDYYDIVTAMQETELRAPINELKSLLFAQTEDSMTEPEGLTFQFNPLYQQDQESMIRTRNIQADIDTKMINAGVYDSFEVAENRYGTGEYSYETTLDMNADAREVEQPEVPEDEGSNDQEADD